MQDLREFDLDRPSKLPRLDDEPPPPPPAVVGDLLFRLVCVDCAARKECIFHCSPDQHSQCDCILGDGQPSCLAVDADKHALKNKGFRRETGTHQRMLFRLELLAAPSLNPTASQHRTAQLMLQVHAQMYDRPWQVEWWFPPAAAKRTDRTGAEWHQDKRGTCDIIALNGDGQSAT